MKNCISEEISWKLHLNSAETTGREVLVTSYRVAVDFEDSWEKPTPVLGSAAASGVIFVLIAMDRPAPAHHHLLPDPKRLPMCQSKHSLLLRWSCDAEQPDCLCRWWAPLFNIEASSTQDAHAQRKQMGHVDVNESIHTACKQHQRICVRICARASSVDWKWTWQWRWGWIHAFWVSRDRLLLVVLGFCNGETHVFPEDGLPEIVLVFDWGCRFGSGVTELREARLQHLMERALLHFLFRKKGFLFSSPRIKEIFGERHSVRTAKKQEQNTTRIFGAFRFTASLFGNSERL